MRFHFVTLIISFLLFETITAQQNTPFIVDHSSYLSKHDIVYLEPEMEGYNGFPVGNGDLGGIVWCHNNGLNIQLNKIDLYDNPGADLMTLRAAAQLKIDFGVPCYSYLHLTDFEGRLSLHGAKIRMHSSTAFADTKVESFVDANSNVWVIDCEAEYKEILTGGAKAVVNLERWGSRPFRSWYSSVEPKPENGLGKTETRILGNDLVIEETFDGGLKFSVVCRVIQTPVKAERISNHTLTLHTELLQRQHFQVLVAVVTSKESQGTTESARELLDRTEKKGVAKVSEAHQQWWDSFWKQSFVHLADDYIENIYYIRRYLMGSSSRGSYLVPFNGGLWVWNLDHRQWVTPHHWNTQSSYWGLAVQNDIKLMRPYIDTYFRLMPAAEKYALSRGAKDAILWTEAHDFSGGMVSAKRNDMINDFTPASQIGVIFWEYYKFTRSKACLRDTVYPFIKKAAEFYLQYLQWDETKQEYFIFPAQPYEHPENNQLKNTTSDRYMIEFLLKSCIEAATTLKMDADKLPKWKQVLTHLWEPPVLDLPSTGRVFGIAYKPNGDVYPSIENYPKVQAQLYHFDAHTTSVYPAGVLGLDQEGSDYFNIACNIASRQPAWRNAITPGSIVSARLGQGDMAMEKVRNSINHLQHFTQGLFYNIDHWYLLSLYSDQVKNPELELQRDYVYDRRTRYVSNKAGTSGLYTYPFIQCGLEPMGIIGTTLNEMLIQSHENKIRIFPAIPAKGAYAFRLRARDAFMVSSIRDTSGYIPEIEIESLQGNTCRLQNPWKNRVKITSSAGKVIKYDIDKDNVISFKTTKGELYSILPAGAPNWQPVQFASSPNMQPKFLGYAILGKERTFWVPSEK
jgi:alpha-L-fucosidase 2